MAMSINTDDCITCGACESECPTGSIAQKKAAYVINAETCTECAGDSPACVSVCPVDSCITQAGA